VAVEAAELAQVVAVLTGSPEPGTWRAEQLYDPVAAATAGLWRVSGDAWSVVLKLIHHGHDRHPRWPSSTDPDDWSYWKREVLAYRSGLTTSFAGGLRGPTCVAIFDRADGTVALWLEDVGRGAPGTSWTVASYEPAARDIGQAQGALALVSPTSSEPWLSRHWLRAYLAGRDEDLHLLADDGVWAHPLVRATMPRSWAHPLRAMRDDQTLFLDTLDRLPRTVCHLDLHPANLFAVDGDTVLIDWAYVGIGALAEDPGVLVADAVLDFHVAPERFDELYDTVRRGYEEGLRRAGWSGPTALVDLGMSAGLAARYAWIGPAILRCVAEQRATLNRRPVEEGVKCWARTLPYLLDRAERARRLAASV